jgi:signal transduction histidine kinase
MLLNLRGLRIQLLLWIILPLILVVVGVSAVGIYSHQVSMRDLVRERDGELARVAAGLVSERLNEHIRLLETLVQTGESPLPSLPEFDGGLALLDAQGGIVIASPTRETWAARGELWRPWLEKLRQGKSPICSDPVNDPVGGQRALFIGVPTADDGALVGLASFAHLGLPDLINNLGTGQREVTFLVDGRGVTIYHPDAAQEGRDISDHSGIAQLVQGEQGAAFHHKPGGEEVVIGYAPVPPAEWGLVVQEPWADAVAPLMRVSEWTPIILLLTSVIALLVIFFGVRYIIRPLQELDRRAARVAWGDFGAVQQPVGGVQEIETLRRTLDQMASQIKSYQAALHDYLAAVTLAQEEERQRLARELHDDTTQTLIALTHRLEMCEKAASDPARLAGRLNELRELVTGALQSVRRLIYDLRPIYLEDMGLLSALDMLAGDVGRTAGAPRVKLDVVGTPRRLPADMELAVYRIVQEALSNVVRHAKATTAQVRVEFGDEGLTLTVEDDGVGFAVPDTPHTLARDGHFGLMGMRERALRFGGHLSLRSQPGEGTTVVVYLSYPPDSAGGTT